MNAELHILYHFRVRGVGAEGVHIAGIANGFRALGHTVAFVSPTGADPVRDVGPDQEIGDSRPTLPHQVSSPPILREIGVGQSGSPVPTILSAIAPSATVEATRAKAGHPFPPSSPFQPQVSPACSAMRSASRSIAGRGLIPHPFLTRFLHACADRAPQAAFECMELLYNIPARTALRHALRKQRPDLLYERYAFFNMAGAQFARRYGLPLILEVNELSGPERVRKQVFVNMAQRIELQIFKQADLIVVVSEFLKDNIAQRLGDDRKIMVVPNGVDRAWLQTPATDDERGRLRAQWGIAPDRKIIGFIGGLVHWHRFDFLFDAMAGLRQTHPEAVLLLVGEGPFEKRLREIIERLGLGKTVFLAGAVSHAAVRAVVDIFDVALIPHSNDFRSPIKLFEYMGAGKAVLAPRVPPVAAVIDDGNDGLLFEPLNVASLVEAAGRLLSDPTRCRELGRKARLKVEKNYLWDHHARRILERFETVQTGTSKFH